MQGLTEQTKNVTLEQTVFKCISLLTRITMAKNFSQQMLGGLQNADGSSRPQIEAKIVQQVDENLVILALDGIHDRL